MINDRIKQMPARSPGNGRHFFVLVVDDEKRIADTLALILASKDYGSQAAYDGTSALEMCRERTPDLIITDVVMSGMNGIEIAISGLQPAVFCCFRVKQRLRTCSKKRGVVVTN